jgi:hypothetical protein
MKKNLKLKVISSSVLLLAFNSSAHAQWAVIDPANIAQTTIVAAKSTLTAVYDYYGMLANAANGQGIQENTQAINLMQKQSVLNLETQDMMNRKALGDAKLGSIAYDMLPTLAACAEASGNTPNSPKGAAGRAAVSGGGGGSQGGEARAKMVTSTLAGQAAVLKEQRELGTCIAELEGSAGCSGNGVYAGADMHPRGIKGNVKGIARSTEDGSAYNSYTLDAEAFKVAKKYAGDMTYYDKPKVPTPAQLERNPAYAVAYRSMEGKLDAAQDTFMDIIRFKKESPVSVIGTVPGKMWSDISDAEYTKVTGLAKKPRDKPAMYDILNFQVNNDYYGNEKADLKSMEEVNKRLALSNYLNWQQYKQQENTNILLAHILVQLTTPVNKSQVDAEFNKTVSGR